MTPKQDIVKKIITVSTLHSMRNGTIIRWPSKGYFQSIDYAIKLNINNWLISQIPFHTGKLKHITHLSNCVTNFYLHQIFNALYWEHPNWVENRRIGCIKPFGKGNMVMVPIWEPLTRSEFQYKMHRKKLRRAYEERVRNRKTH